MPEKPTREQIVEAADRLFYRQGYEYTSFAHIAADVGISRGNFYHHFKSKDQILDAVIAARLRNTQRLLEKWEAASDTPVERIQSFISILIHNRKAIARSGCPVGTLCTELAKLEHASLTHANELFTLFHNWLRRQFTLLGLSKDADALAMHLLARSQGVAVLVNAFHDQAFIRREVDQLNEWLSACVYSATSSPAAGRDAHT